MWSHFRRNWTHKLCTLMDDLLCWSPRIRNPFRERRASSMLFWDATEPGDIQPSLMHTSLPPLVTQVISVGPEISKPGRKSNRWKLLTGAQMTSPPKLGSDTRLIAKRKIHVLTFPSAEIWPRHGSPQYNAQKNTRGNMEATIKSASGTIKRDLSQPSARDEVVETLHTSGWIIIKGGATTTSPHEAQDNKYVVALLSHANADIRIGPSGPVHHDQIPNPPIARAPDWRDMASRTKIVAVMAYHLQGNPDSAWRWGYDKGLKEEQMGEEELVQASGGDLIICNAWLARRVLPKPQSELDLIYVNYSSLA
ncbi:hypothetical protein I7I51_05363 [Histoplasma capsulatum]|uniref:Uncharacterized protein n=1 Tax=Ajellomyces capsulatus TaxID=5037 RepID=A0A8A1M755_AJECA|nr:hypothetical protein I7I51_05363 [Histoplasma capsulatum]